MNVHVQCTLLDPQHHDPQRFTRNWNVDRRHFENEVPPELEIKRSWSVSLQSARSTVHDIVCCAAFDDVSVLVKHGGRKNEVANDVTSVGHQLRDWFRDNAGVRRSLHVKI